MFAHNVCSGPRNRNLIFIVLSIISIVWILMYEFEYANRLGILAEKQKQLSDVLPVFQSSSINLSSSVSRSLQTTSPTQQNTRSTSTIVPATDTLTTKPSTSSTASTTTSTGAIANTSTIATRTYRLSNLTTITFVTNISTSPDSSATGSTLNTTTWTRESTTPDPWRDRCKEVRRRVSHGLEDYARRSGDVELQALVQPIFKSKRLVVWSADHHIGPMSDLRSLFEPLGVEFLEHTLYHSCEIMCTCDQQSRIKVLNHHSLIHPLGNDMIDRFVREYKNDSDFQRADAYLSSWSAGLLEVYMRYNKSIIFHVPLRLDRPVHGQADHFKVLVSLIQRAATNEENVMAANNRYDVHYIKYFTGMSIDYVPSFCVYTGETYNPIRKSYLLWERRNGFNHGLAEYWSEHFDGHIRRTGAKFDLRDVRTVYRGHEHRDVAKHLGITYIPYQVSVMSFFEQYRMDIPLFCPSLEFLIFLHHRLYTVYDRTRGEGRDPSMRGSPFPPHPSMAGTPDPNNDFDLPAISYWLPLSDCYQFPHITYYTSFENLVDTLYNMTETRLWSVSRSMASWNRENLKEILRYWRRRLLNIAFYRQLGK